MTEYNTGSYNSGNRNSGNRNTGNRNAGDCNTGFSNAGDYNSGNRNTGNYNSGIRNSGFYNTGSFNTGNFNTTTPDTVNFFNKPLSLSKWDEALKPAWLFKPRPTAWDTDTKTLRTNDMKEEWNKAFKTATKEEVQQVLDLPNFDSEVFKEITGLELGDHSPDCDGRTVVIDGETYRLVKE